MGYAKGIRWTDELIEQKILEVVEGLGLKRMPSRKECEDYFHNTALCEAVGRRMGWYALANKMGLPVKESETFFGKKHETIVEEALRAKGFEVQRMSQNFPYDMLVDRCVKIDAKASRLYRGPQGNFYTFNLEKSYATCDFYLLLTISDNGGVIDRYIVPSTVVMSQNQISIGEKRSKYHKYRDRFELIEKAVSFWSDLSEQLQLAYPSASIPVSEIKKG